MKCHDLLDVFSLKTYNVTFAQGYSYFPFKGAYHTQSRKFFSRVTQTRPIGFYTKVFC